MQPLNFRSPVVNPRANPGVMDGPPPSGPPKKPPIGMRNPPLPMPNPPKPMPRLGPPKEVSASPTKVPRPGVNFLLLQSWQYASSPLCTIFGARSSLPQPLQFSFLLRNDIFPVSQAILFIFILTETQFFFFSISAESFSLAILVMDIESLFWVFVPIFLVLTIGLLAGSVRVYQWYTYEYYYVKYYDWEAIDLIFQDPAVLAYFKNWGAVERQAKTSSPEEITCTGKAIMWYRKWIRNFTPVEKEILDHSVKYLRGCGGIHRDWKFVKIHSSLEFGYPFTLSEYIFVPHRWLEKTLDACDTLSGDNNLLTYPMFAAAVDRAIHKPWKSSDSDYMLKAFVYILAHERIHIHQRENPGMYKDLITKLGFIEVPKNKIVLDDWTNNNRVTNPDGFLNCAWLIQLRDQWYMPILVMLPDTDKPKGVLIHMVQTSNDVWSPVIYLGNVVYYPIDNFDEYIKRHYLSHGMYDPNEIISYIAADLLTNHKIADTPGNRLIMEFVRNTKIV